jgi:hypothetical protein
MLKVGLLLYLLKSVGSIFITWLLLSCHRNSFIKGFVVGVFHSNASFRKSKKTFGNWVCFRLQVSRLRHMYSAGSFTNNWSQSLDHSYIFSPDERYIYTFRNVVVEETRWWTKSKSSLIRKNSLLICCLSCSQKSITDILLEVQLGHSQI